MDRFTFDDLYVRRLKEHDPEVEAHFDKYFRGVLLAKLHTRLPAQDIDDAIQDVLWRAQTRLDELRESCKLAAFVLGICKYVLLERYGKKESRTEPLEERHLRIHGKLDIEEELLRKEAAAAVRQILSEMRKTREVEVLLALLDDQDRDEICRRFNISAENLRVVLHRARKKFAAAFRRKNKL